MWQGGEGRSNVQAGTLLTQRPEDWRNWKKERKLSEMTSRGE